MKITSFGPVGNGLTAELVLVDEDGNPVLVPDNGSFALPVATDERLLREAETTNRLLRELIRITRAGLHPLMAPERDETL